MPQNTRMRLNGTRYDYFTIGVPSNGGLRDGGLRKSEALSCRKKAFFLRFLDFPGALRTLRKRAKPGRKRATGGRFRPISGKGGQTPLKPPFVTPPFAACPVKAILVKVG